MTSKTFKRGKVLYRISTILSTYNHRWIIHCETKTCRTKKWKDLIDEYSPDYVSMTSDQKEEYRKKKINGTVPIDWIEEVLNEAKSEVDNYKVAY